MVCRFFFARRRKEEEEQGSLSSWPASALPPHSGASRRWRTTLRSRTPSTTPTKTPRARTRTKESGDGNGRVQGRYTLSLADGRTRTVTYTADENGYRAEIVTNEQGTESKNPADVVIQSSALPGPEAAIANEPNRLRG
ncbi:hypothetical protein MRX96_047613 [Rhipicephalus microplus]